MADDLITLEGIVVPPSGITNARARQVVAALQNPNCTHAELEDCMVHDGRDLLIFNVEVQRPQRPVHDIRRVEPIAARFSADDNRAPEVLSLRADFPIVPHLNLNEVELQRSLCLYERPWSEIRLTWSGASFIEQIRRWLAQTARGELHDEDQPLEPLMFSHGFELIVPCQLGLNDKPTSEVVSLTLVNGKEGRVFVADDPRKALEGNGQFGITLYINTPPRTHGVIHRAPTSLTELAGLVNANDYDLVPQLARALRNLPEDWRKNRVFRRNVRPIVILGLPKTRHEGGKVEAVELKGFLCSDNIETLGAKLGAWVVQGNELGFVLNSASPIDPAPAQVVAVNVIRRINWRTAARANGRPERDSRKLLAIGAGALGSQIAMNFARAGSGQWTLIDNDFVMPHNLARHALADSDAVGFNKANCVATTMNMLVDDAPIAHFLAADYLRPESKSEDLKKCVSEADVILDMSASVPVARSIAMDESAPRAISLFLSPSGHDLVMFAEDAHRNIRLDELEMTYYQKLATDKELKGHLDAQSAGGLRYGGSCRDVSSRIAQCHVATHAGIGAAAVQQTLDSDGATIRIWRQHPATLAIAPKVIEPERFTKQTQGAWQLCVAECVLRQVAGWRNERLPNETGGILIGHVDQEHERIFLLMALPSPSDSDEWPTMYIRGVEGLRTALAEVVNRTNGFLDYLGEWHSHPARADTTPSPDDRNVFGKIDQWLAGEGRPPIMLIAGDGGRSRVFVDAIEPVPQPIAPPPIASENSENDEDVPK